MKEQNEGGRGVGWETGNGERLASRTAPPSRQTTRTTAGTSCTEPAAGTPATPPSAPSTPATHTLLRLHGPARITIAPCHTFLPCRTIFQTTLRTLLANPILPWPTKEMVHRNSLRSCLKFHTLAFWGDRWFWRNARVVSDVQRVRDTLLSRTKGKW